MKIVTGGAGFIGSNIVKQLNNRGIDDILIVDDLTDGRKCRNLQGLAFYDYMDYEDFAQEMADDTFDCGYIDVVFHEGACSDTMNYDGRYMMKNNYEGSKNLLRYCMQRKIPFLYASSASTYGSGKHGFREVPECEQALNPYAYSKLQFDRFVRRILPLSKGQIVGFRYFNVFGPQENHKDRMASLIYQKYHELQKTGKITLFEGTGGFGNGEQVRDFIYVNDVVNVIFYFWEHPELSGIYNCGTGTGHTFNDFVHGIIEYCGKGTIEYVPFPEILKGKYQSYTQADTTKLMAAGYDRGFTLLHEAVKEYCSILEKSDGYYE